ncbi:sigma-54-dependent Fis family transcriptional regulator [bacterium]|nr:sigma-54-dependent Fis family transcriptional regulator [bacterium]
MARVLIVEDDSSFREVVGLALKESGHEIATAANESEALKALDGGVDLALLDLGLPEKESGFSILDEMKKRSSTVPVIVLTGEKDMASHVRAMRDGAFDYVTKPVDVGQLERVIERALKPNGEPGTGEAIGLVARARTTPLEEGPLSELLGESPAMREVFKALGLLSASRATVLIRGESGTGKELAARALHNFSKATEKPFISVNCAALPGTLIEAELFGYRRGAFTGAERDRAGKLEAAEEGTLFLDEVGDVPLEVQVKLLRVLQERKYERLGETDSRPFKARVIAATHRDLEAMVREGRFREDLYFRLNVATITLPPLRERREDIPLLTERLLGEIGREIGRPMEGVSVRALDRLLTYDWPGNVRELRNALTRAAVKARGGVIGAQDFAFGQIEAPDAGGASAEAAAEAVSRFPTLDEVEREHIRRALARARGHRGKTCKLLGISRPTLVRKLRKYKIDAGPGGAGTPVPGAEGI